MHINTEIFLRDRYVSKYPSATAFAGEDVLLSEELVKIKSGYYSLVVNPCREAFRRNKDEYAKLKSKLPAITFCGLFKGSHKKENLIFYNNLVIVDIDHIPIEQIEDIKEKLFLDKYIFACWLSPSGIGLKALVCVESNPIMHKFCFDRILDYLLANYEIQADVSGSDVCRLCFVSHDEKLFCKKHIETFPMNEDEWLISLISEERTGGKKNNLNKSRTKEEIYLESEKILFFRTEGRNEKGHREMVKKITTYLRKSEQSITENYHSWLRVAIAVSNTFTYDIGKNIFLELCRLDGLLHDEYKSEQLLQYCYCKRRIGEINFGSIVYLATQKGFVITPLKKIKT